MAKKANEKKKRLTQAEKIALGWDWIFRPYITIKGKRIYHPTGGVFRFLGDPNYKKK